MDIYPVYAMYKVDLTTNIDDAGLGEEAQPEIPTWSVDQDGNLTVQLRTKKEEPR